ncbi:MAG: FdhD protein [Thermodesulfobacteriota bacterium]|nr:FdhD protein [Thermodesulfobacteriota bacterium]
MSRGFRETVDAESEHPASGATDKVEDVTGVVLAGGRSSRYGKNKALVTVKGVPLIERALQTMGAIFHHVVMITNTPDEYAYLDVPMFKDVIKGLGPLGGIYTGLKVIPDPAGFFVACDMPFLNPGLIRHMVTIRDDFDVVVPKISWKVEALHGLYAKSCIDSIERLIRSGTYQIFRFFSSVSVRFINDDEIRRWDPDLSSFLNINTPDELRRLEQPDSGREIAFGDRALRHISSRSEPSPVGAARS